MSTTEISISANITKLRQELAQIPNITDKEARAMSSALMSQMKKSEKAAKKAATGSKKAWNGFQQEIKQTGKSVENFTESAGDADSVLMGVSGALDLVDKRLGDMARVAGDSLAGVEALGRSVRFSNPVFLALAAAAAVLGGAYMLLSEDAEDAAEEIKELKEQQEALDAVLGGSATNTQTYSEQLAVLNGTMTESDAQFRAVQRTVQKSFDEQLEKSNIKLKELDENLQKVKGSYNANAESVTAFKARVKDARDEYDKQGTSIRELERAQKKEVLAAGEVIIKKREIAEAAKAQTEAEDRATEASDRAKEKADELRAADEKRLQALEFLGNAAETSSLDQLGALDLIQLEYEKQIALIDELIEKYPDDVEMKAAAETAKAEATARASREMYAELGTQAQKFLDEEQKNEEKAAERRDASRAKEEEAELKSAEKVAAAKATAIDMVSTLQTTAADWSEKLAEDGTESGKAAAWKAFEISKAAAIADIAIKTAQSVMTITAQTGVAAPPLVAAALALSAAQIGLVAGQSPSFHAGGLIGHNGTLQPDETTITARRGEGVVSQAGMSRLGKSGLDALNHGVSPSSQIVVTQQYQHRSFGAFIQKDIQQPNSPLRKAIRGETRIGHKSRRI